MKLTTTDIVEENVIQQASALNKYRRNPDSLKLYAKKLLQYARENNSQKGQVIAYNRLAIVAKMKAHFPKSNQYYHQALKIAQNLDDKTFSHSIMNGIAQNHRETQYYDSAFYYFDKVNAYYIKKKLLFPASMTQTDIGITYFKLEKLDSAIGYFDKAIIGFRAEKNKRFVAQNLSLLAEVYFQKEDFITALEKAKESQVISEEINLKKNYARNYQLIARIYDAQHKPDEAKMYYDLEEKHKRPTRNSNIKNRRTLNEIHHKNNSKFLAKKIGNLNQDKAVYKGKLFISLITLAVLSFIAFILFRRNKNSQKEVKILQEELNSFKENKLNKENTSNNKTIQLKSKAIIDINDILYIKSDGHYVEYYLRNKNKPEIDRNSLTNAVKQLPETIFVRIHKSYIVNIYEIRIINSTKVMLDNGTWINLSRSCKQKLKGILHKDS